VVFFVNFALENAVYSRVVQECLKCMLLLQGISM
jgi:hypothetical protein